jgi:hypothetical protein
MAVQRQEHGDDYTDDTKNETNITLEISPAIQRRIKQSAAENHLSVEEYLERIIDQTESKPLTQEKLAGIFRAMEEIQQHTQGQVFEDTVEVIRKMREERSRELGFDE